MAKITRQRRRPLLRGVLLLAVLIAALISLSCAAEPPRTTIQPWQLEYRVSGGFAGTSVKITLDHLGHFRRLDEQTYKLIERKLPPAQLAPIHDAVIALAESEAPIPPAHYTCNDCFRYDLELTIDGNTRQYHHLSGMDTSDQLLNLIQALQFGV